MFHDVDIDDAPYIDGYSTVNLHNSEQTNEPYMANYRY